MLMIMFVISNNLRKILMFVKICSLLYVFICNVGINYVCGMMFVDCNVGMSKIVMSS